MLKQALLSAVALFALVGHAQAEDLKEFRVGITAGKRSRPPAQLPVPRRSAPGSHRRREGLPFPAADYDGVIQGLLGGTLDYAELGASGYAKIYLAKADAVEPILTTVQTDGSTGYHSIMVARKDSGITKLEDLKGKKLGFADPDSTSGYLVPLVTLPEAIGAPVKEYFGETGFGGGHENLVLEVVKGTFDAGTTFGSGVGEFKDGYTSGNLRKMVDKGIVDMNDLVELWKSPLIPNGPIVVRTALNDDMKAKFKQFMMDLPKTDAACFSAIQGGDFTGFVEVNSDFYKPIIDARKATIGG